MHVDRSFKGVFGELLSTLGLLKFHLFCPVTFLSIFLCLSRSLSYYLCYLCERNDISPSFFFLYFFFTLSFKRTALYMAVYAFYMQFRMNFHVKLSVEKDLHYSRMCFIKQHFGSNKVFNSL